ncbi:MAG TPA: hypothetical protein VMT00_10795 [Thermoanaerobaculia bacterium]|nr:hypothetical protein [Thermoanaerobaculia bacterium]
MARTAAPTIFATTITITLMSALLTAQTPATTGAYPEGPLHEAMHRLDTELVAAHGEAIQPRLERGMKQAGKLWRPEDGDAATFEQFVRTHFARDQRSLDEIFNRLQYNFEQLGGHMLEIVRAFREQVDLDRGPILPVDDILAAYDPSAHTIDDLFQNKLAFAVLLNFPLTTLDERLAGGDAWSRHTWAEARLAQRFSRRVPADVNVAVARANADADKYIAEYNIWMHHLLTDKGERLFPPKLRLLSHWNLRDEIRAQYSETTGLPKQRMIQQVMERIVTQTIPEIVVDNPAVDWNPYSNVVTPAAVSDSDVAAEPGRQISNAPEPDTRYARLLDNFLAERKVDSYSPTAPTLIERKFNEAREIPEARVRAMFDRVLTSPLVPQVAALIEKRLGRRLEPFDVWYNGFRPRGRYTEAELDAIVREKYPTAEAFQKDLPNILVKLGFTPEKAAYLAGNIVVDPARGSGHAWGAQRREDRAHLRTRIGATGMDYKGYNIAIHELGHNVEQTFSLNDIDHWFLEGVPNTAFTEALAFVFQGRDLEVLGLTRPDAESEALKALAAFWQTFEIAGVGLVDMGVWHWMYENPGATPAQLREATLRISKDIWNRYYAPVFRKKDVVLLGIYSHMIGQQLYLPDYPLGQMIAFQIEEQMARSGNVAAELERVSKIGNVTPDLWMRQATGAPVGPDALLAAARRALGQIRR